MNLFTKQKQITEKKLWLPGAKDGGRGRQGVWDQCVHTAVFKKDNQQGPTVQHGELGSMLCDILDGRRVREKMDTHICMAESLHCSLETTTTQLIGYTPIQNKTFKV